MAACRAAHGSGRNSAGNCRPTRLSHPSPRRVARQEFSSGLSRCVAVRRPYQRLRLRLVRRQPAEPRFAALWLLSQLHAVEHVLSSLLATMAGEVLSYTATAILFAVVWTICFRPQLERRRVGLAAIFVPVTIQAIGMWFVQSMRSLSV